MVWESSIIEERETHSTTQTTAQSNNCTSRSLPESVRVTRVSTKFTVKSRLDAVNKIKRYHRIRLLFPALKYGAYVAVLGWKLSLLCEEARCLFFEVVLLPFQRCLASKGTSDRCVVFCRWYSRMSVFLYLFFLDPPMQTRVCVCVCVGGCVCWVLMCSVRFQSSSWFRRDSRPAACCVIQIVKSC